MQKPFDPAPDRSESGGKVVEFVGHEIDGHQHDQGGSHDHQQVAEWNAAHEHHAHHCAEEQGCRGEVGEGDEGADDSRHDEDFPEGIAEAFFRALLDTQDLGCINDQGQFGEFCGLKGEKAQVEGSSRGISGHARQLKAQGQHQQQDAHCDHSPCDHRINSDLHHIDHDDDDPESQSQEDNLPDQEVKGISPGLPEGQGSGGAVDDQQREHRQQQEQDPEDLVSPDEFPGVDFHRGVVRGCVLPV